MRIASHVDLSNMDDIRPKLMEIGPKDLQNQVENPILKKDYATCIEVHEFVVHSNKICAYDAHSCFGW